MLRLTKLLRLLRTSRLVTRLEDHAGFHYSYLSLARFAISTVLLAHWMARAQPRRTAAPQSGRTPPNAGPETLNQSCSECGEAT